MDRRYTKPPYFVTPRAYFENLGYEFRSDLEFAAWFSGSVERAEEYARAAAESAEAAEQAQKTAVQRALDAEAWACGTRDGQDVPEEDPAYEASARTYAQTAEDAAGRAEQIAADHYETVDSRLDEQDDAIEALRVQASSPFDFARTAADLTDTTRCYVWVSPTATVDGVTFEQGAWYYRDGTVWVKGGMQVDTTLSLPGVAADSAETGGQVESAKMQQSKFAEAICKREADKNALTFYPNPSAINSNTGEVVVSTSGKYMRTTFWRSSKTPHIIVLNNPKYRMCCWSYDEDNNPTHPNTPIGLYQSGALPIVVNPNPAPGKTEKYIIAFCRADGAVLTWDEADPESDYNIVRNAIRALYVTDPTLSIQNAAADAAAVGAEIEQLSSNQNDMIALTLNSETRIELVDVPAKIDAETGVLRADNSGKHMRAYGRELSAAPHIIVLGDPQYRVCCWSYSYEGGQYTNPSPNTPIGEYQSGALPIFIKPRPGLAETERYIMAFCRDDDAVMNMDADDPDSDYNYLKTAVRIMRATDPTLSIQNAAADAAAVGAALKNAGAWNRDTVGEIFSRAADVHREMDVLEAQYHGRMTHNYLSQPLDEPEEGETADEQRMRLYRIEFGGTTMNGGYNTVNRPRYQKPVAFVTGCIHGSEKASGNYIVDFVRRMLDDIELSTVASSFVWYIIPVVNIWGFNRDTRENAQGLDINRDFSDAEYTLNGTTYGFQTPEAAIIKDIYDNHDVRMYIDCHQFQGAIRSNQVRCAFTSIVEEAGVDTDYLRLFRGIENGNRYAEAWASKAGYSEWNGSQIVWSWGDPQNPTTGSNSTACATAYIRGDEAYNSSGREKIKCVSTIETGVSCQPITGMSTKYNHGAMRFGAMYVAKMIQSFGEAELENERMAGR